MRLLQLAIFLVSSFYLSGQSFTHDNYYLFPIKPGQQNYLAGTMGEMRASHFHAGLDIKTDGQTGLPVYAAADGYISRIRVATSGYGQALYLTHPNGTTTVYAHLDRFQDEIDQYVLEQQYAEESYEVQFFPQKEQFQFRQGEVIAYSGNTGSSSGPHLHFEIRDLNQRILDPLKFNFKEIKDDIRPVMKNIAFVTLDGNARINNTYGRYQFDVLRTGDVYNTRVPIKLQGNIGVEIYAYDLLNGVWNRNGIPEITMLIDGDTIFQQLKTSLSFSKQRNILVHMDYDAYRNVGRKYNKLFIDDGNTNDFYTIPSNGYFFTDSVHTVTIHMKDSYGNISTFESLVNNRKVLNPPDPRIEQFETYRNHLHFRANYSVVPNDLKLYLGGGVADLSPYRTDSKAAYYLWDLRNGLPDSIYFCGEMIRTGIYAMIPSNEEISFYNHDVDLFFDKYTLFDTLYLSFKKGYDSINQLELFEFPHLDYPLRSSVGIQLKPKNTYPEKSQVYSYYAGNLSYLGGEWADSLISFRASNFGTFTIAQDSIAPEITPRIINEQEVYFKIEDDLSGIKSYKATLNGSFLLMKYEYKRDLIWSVKKDENIPIKGVFILEVIDNAGNINTYKRTL